MSTRSDEPTAQAPQRPNDAAAQFALFVAQHGRSLGKLAYLLLGDADAAEDLSADVFLAAWRQWDRVQQAHSPVAYLRQVTVNLAATRVQRIVRERRGLERLHRTATPSGYEPDSAAAVDVRAALQRLPPRRRACLVLRFAFDLAEREVADLLGISVGTVKSQTSKAVLQFRRELGDALVDTRDFPETLAAGSSRWEGTGSSRWEGGSRGQ